MASDKLVLELSVDDKGTATIKNFAQASKQAMGEVSRSTQETSSHIGSLKNSWAMMVTGVAASVYLFKQAADIVSSLTQDFIQQEEAEMKLAIAMRTHGAYTRESFNDLKAYAEQIQKTTIYSDDAALSTMALLHTYGISGKVLKEATMATMNFATAQGRDLHSVALIVGKAFQGQTETIGRFGIKIEEGTESGKKFGAVLEAMNNMAGPAAQAMLETYGGQWKYLANVWSDIKEKVGYGILKAIEATVGGLAWFGSKLHEWAANALDAISLVFGALGKLPDIMGGAKFREWGKDFSDTADWLRDVARSGMQVSDQFFKMYNQVDKVADAVEKFGAGKGLKIIDEDALKRAKELEKILAKIAEDYVTSWGIMVDKEQEALDQMARMEAEKIMGWNKLSDEQRDKYIESLGIMADAQEEAMNEVIRDRTKKAEEIWKIERKLTEDIAKFTKSEFEFKRESIVNQAKAYEELGVDRIRIEQWVNTQLVQLEEERILQTQDFWAGLKVAYAQDLRDQRTWAQQGAFIWRSVFGRGGALEGTLTDFFTDVFQGQLKSASDYFNSFKNAIISAFAKMVAEMVTIWVSSQIASMFGLGYSAPATAGGSLFNALFGGGASAASAGSGAGAAAAAGGAAATGGASMAGYGMSGAGAGAAGLAMAGEYGVGAAGSSAAGSATAGAAAGGAGAAAAVGGMGIGLAAWIYLASKYSAGTQRFLNPFSPNSASQSDLGYWALMEGGFPAGAYIGGNQERVKQGYGIVANDPFFDPANLRNLFISAFGFNPSDDYTTASGTPYLWLRNTPEYKAAVGRVSDFVGKYITADVTGSEGSYGVSYTAMARGGIINEPIVGMGASGRRYLFGESGPERVTPIANNRNQMSPTVNINIDGNLIADKNTFNRFVEQIHEQLTRMQNWGYR